MLHVPPALLAATIALFGGSGIVPRAFKPHPTPYRMANVAQLVVEGVAGAGGQVTITRQHFAAPGLTPGAIITVPALVDISRTPFQWGRQNAPIETDRVLLFLADNPRGDEWVPLHLLEGNARGVLWFGAGEVWGYSQMINPGPYELTRWNEREAPGQPPVLAEPDDIRAQIADGLRARGLWQAVLELGDAEIRAREIARWFSPATSPDGWRWQERLWPDLREAAKAQGEAIVLPLARVVATDADASAVGCAVMALIELGDVARASAPMLIARLRDLRGAQPIDLLRGLAALGDEPAIPVLRDFVQHENDFVAAAAGRALHCCGDAEAARRLAARVPRRVDGDHPVAAVAELLDALNTIDAAAAVAMVKQRFLDEPELLGARGWLRRVPPGPPR